MYVSKLPKNHKGKKLTGRGSLALIAVPVSVIAIGAMLLTLALVARSMGYTQFDVFIHSSTFETIVWSFSIPTALVLATAIWLGKRHAHEHRYAAAAQYTSMAILGLLAWAVIFGMYVVIPLAFAGPGWDAVQISSPVLPIE